MKFKKLFFLGSILTISLFATAFINPSNETQKKGELIEPNIELNEEPFSDFLNQFKKIEIPYEIKLEDFPKAEKLKKKNNTLSKKLKKKHKSNYRAIMRKYIPELERGLYSRMGPPEIEPLVRFTPNENSIAVIYKAYWPLYLNNSTNFALVVYDKQGNNVTFPKEKGTSENHSFLLASESPFGASTCSIDESGNIWRNNYEYVYKDNVEEKGFEENEIVHRKLVKTEIFQIRGNGLVETVNENDLVSRVSLN